MWKERVNGMGETFGEGAAECAKSIRNDAEKAIKDVRSKGFASFFSFDHMYFPIISRYVFILACIAIAVYTLVLAVLGLVGMFGGDVLGGIAILVLAPVSGALLLLASRLWFEVMTIQFIINRNLESIRDKIR